LPDQFGPEEPLQSFQVIPGNQRPLAGGTQVLQLVVIVGESAIRAEKAGVHA
jgi:hypothetical protein